MTLRTRLSEWFKAAPPAAPASRVAALAGPMATLGPAGGWWRDDPAEQLRQYQSWVYAAVSAIAHEVATQTPQLFRDTGPADHEQTPLPLDHPLARLLARPNPWLTPWELWYLTTVYLELTGDCFWYVAPGPTGLPAELWVVPTPWVSVVPDAANFVKHYEVLGSGPRPEVFTPDEIVHVKYPDPADPHRGLSPLRANALSVDANLELLKSRHQTFRAGSRPGVVLQTDQTLTDQTVRRLEETLEGKFAGRQNWHRPMVLEQGLKASPWTLTPAEMDFLNSSRLSRDEILALFRVPPPITGVVENAGLGGGIWDGARTMFCESTVQPKLELLGQTLTRDLGRRFGPDVVIRFPDCSPRRAEQRRKDDEQDARLGLRTTNEIRRGRGWSRSPTRGTTCRRRRAGDGPADARRWALPTKPSSRATFRTTETFAMTALAPASSMMPLADGTFGSAHPAARTLTVDGGKMRVRSVITTGQPDRAGDVVVPTGLKNRDEYLLNPVVLWAHNRSGFPPIGVCEWLDVQPTRVVAETRFAQGVPFAEDVFRLFEQGILRGWSIGFVPRRAFRQAAPGSTRAGLRVEEWDLLEYSAVPIPENPGALTVALEKGVVKDVSLREWLSRVPDDRGGRWWRAGDVLAKLVRPIGDAAPACVL